MKNPALGAILKEKDAPNWLRDAARDLSEVQKDEAIAGLERLLSLLKPAPPSMLSRLKAAVGVK